MNIGDGLTLQTRTINGKPSTGIFLLNSNIPKNSKPKFTYKTKSLRYPIRDKTQEGDGLKSENTKQFSQKNKAGGFRAENAKRNIISQKSLKRNKDLKVENDISKMEEISKDNAKETVAKNESKTKTKNKIVPDIKPINKSIKGAKGSVKPVVDNKKENGTNPKYITLTQDQLNTILSLVKTKHDIDVGSVVEETNLNSKKKKSTNESNSDSADASKSENSEAASDDEVVTIRPTSVPGLDLSSDDEKSKEMESEKKSKHRRPKSSKSKKSSNEKKEEEKPEESAENKENEVKEDEKSENVLDLQWGVLGGYGSREKEKNRLAEQRKQWIKELDDQVNRNQKIKDDELQHKRGIKSLSNNDVVSAEVVEKEDTSENITDLVEDANKKSNQRKNKKSRNSKDEQKEKNKKIKSAPPSAKNKPKPVEIQKVNPENLPAAIRSSFYPGESAPREHAFSASKQEQQRRWRAELDKQREEQQNRKQMERNRRLVEDNEDLWARHFDTMQPKKSMELPRNQPAVENNSEATEVENTNPTNVSNTAPMPSAHLPQLHPEPAESNSNLAAQSSTSIGAMSGLYGENKESSGVRDPNKSTYLRTMTSLLDPAQLEAIEVRRKRQEEHRNAISAQVEEQRKRKELEDNAQRIHDQLEEDRLKQERQRLDQQFEIEKLKQKMQESKREEHTRKLHDQLQQAEANALRDKLKQREKFLRARGHDTSLLEQAHDSTLKSHRPNEPTRKQVTNLRYESPLHHTQAPVVSHSTNSLRLSQDLEPISLTANTEHGPIELKISLNNLGSSTHRGVEAGMQTVSTQNNETQMSDPETEYLSLPQRRNYEGRRKEKPANDKRSNASLKKYEENLGKQYNKYSRKDPSQQSSSKQLKPKQDEPKPKWGVTQKNKKFVPASQRYVKSMKWTEKHEQNIKRREEQLLAQQAMNDREHLQAISRTRVDGEDGPGTNRRPASPVIPALARKMEDDREKRRNRSHSPNKTTQSKQKVPRNRSISPYADNRNQHEVSPRHQAKQRNEASVSRPDTVISVTTENAKYRPGKHSRDSPVPHSSDFVQYRRTADILDPSDDLERPTTRDIEQQNVEQIRSTVKQTSQHKDPLMNPDMVKQRERQDQILHEISILRQGLMLKQREVASYPVAIPTEPHRFFHADNLPERTNDTPHG